MDKKLFGTLATGEEVYIYKIGADNVSAEIITFGAAIRKLEVFGKSVIGGFDSLDSYIADTSHQGATIGRVANRIENAKFTIDGISYDVPKNNNGNCLHGGVGFDRRIWTVKDYSENGITLSYTSPDGEEGFPGVIDTEVTYTIISDSLMIEYKAVPSKKTPIALTNHSYFNLDGFGGDIKSQFIKIYADSYTAVNEFLIPTGEHPSVLGTPFNLTERKAIGSLFSDSFGGYDHNFVLSPCEYAIFKDKKLGLIAEADNEKIKMSVYTDQPGVQFYTANFLGNGKNFSGDIKPIRHGAFCLETQTEPNSVNRGVGIYDVKDVYTHNTVYKFEKLGGDK